MWNSNACNRAAIHVPCETYAQGPEGQGVPQKRKGFLCPIQQDRRGLSRLISLDTIMTENRITFQDDLTETERHARSGPSSNGAVLTLLL